VLVKFAEGVGELTFTVLREEIGRDLLGVVGALLLRPALQRIRKRVDYEEYGGAPLLGVRGTVIVAHGRSGPRAIRNALRLANQAATAKLPEALAFGRRAAVDRVPPEETFEAPTVSPIHE
jgi:glycerol-3-phosphate acyltransferase PlsX